MCRSSENIKHYKLTISEETQLANFGAVKAEREQDLDHGPRGNNSSGSHIGAWLT